MKKRGYDRVVLAVTTIGALLASIQQSAILIALPDILAGLNSSFFVILWILLAYLLVLTAMQPVVGKLADMFGRKNLFVLGFALFTAGSLLAGLALPEFGGWDVVFYRVIQGVGGALLFANSTAMVTDAYYGRRLGFALGVNQIALAAGFVIGPVVGGLLSLISWRWVFLINVPIGIIGTIWAWRSLREPVHLAQSHLFDWRGSATFTIGLGLLLLAASLYAFPLLGLDIVYALFIVGVVVMALFFLVERREKNPVLDFSLFRNRLFTFANIANLLNGLARGAVLFLLIFFLQGPYGQDPFAAGLMMIPFGVTFMIVGPLSGILSDRWGSRELATFGLLVTAVALLGMATIVATTSYWLIALWMAIMGIGSGLFNSPNTRAVMNSVPPERRGIAAGIRIMLTNTGTMVSIAIAFPLVLSKIPQDLLIKVFLFGGGMAGYPEALAAFENGLHTSFLLFFAISIVAAVLSWLRPKES
jgi:EmrB/QacA subfamily drug resistance transporter